MGMLIDGKWTEGRIQSLNGSYERPTSTFRERIEIGGRHPPAPERYHLYISLACPWASRTNMARTLKRLESVVGMTIVHPDMFEDGWKFEPEPDPVLGANLLHQVYTAADVDFTGRVTVPVLWDRERHTIVNNESGDIVRMFDEAFDEWADPTYRLRPEPLISDIDQLQARMYEAVNNGVYRAGFATDQDAYEHAVIPLFQMLAELTSACPTVVS